MNSLTSKRQRPIIHQVPVPAPGRAADCDIWSSWNHNKNVSFNKDHRQQMMDFQIARSNGVPAPSQNKTIDHSGNTSRAGSPNLQEKQLEVLKNTLPLDKLMELKEARTKTGATKIRAKIGTHFRLKTVDFDKQRGKYHGALNDSTSFGLSTQDETNYSFLKSKTRNISTHASMDPKYQHRLLNHQNFVPTHTRKFFMPEVAPKPKCEVSDSEADYPQSHRQSHGPYSKHNFDATTRLPFYHKPENTEHITQKVNDLINKTNSLIQDNQSEPSNPEHFKSQKAKAVACAYKRLVGLIGDNTTPMVNNQFLYKSLVNDAQKFFTGVIRDELQIDGKERRQALAGNGSRWSEFVRSRAMDAERFGHRVSNPEKVKELNFFLGVEYILQTLLEYRSVDFISIKMEIA